MRRTRACCRVVANLCNGGRSPASPRGREILEIVVAALDSLGRALWQALPPYRVCRALVASSASDCRATLLDDRPPSRCLLPRDSHGHSMLMRLERVTQPRWLTPSADLAAAKRSIASGMIEATRETQCGLRAFATKAVLVRAITREGALAIASENPACERKRHFRPPALGETGTEFSTCRCVR